VNDIQQFRINNIVFAFVSKVTAMPAFIHTFLDSADTLDAFVDDWRGHRLPREAWTHGAHVGVCAYFAFDHDEGATLTIMRRGIRTFNESIGGQNTSTSGYHESVTRLWVMTIGAHLRANPAKSRWEASCAAVERFASPRELLQQCYSFDVIGDTRARAEWVPPDRPLPWDQVGRYVGPNFSSGIA
jgi:hypothetical protein